MCLDSRGGNLTFGRGIYAKALGVYCTAFEWQRRDGSIVLFCGDRFDYFESEVDRPN